MDKVDFSAILCSRLCHDLISPVGAMTNGIEILNDEKDEDIRDQVIQLLTQSAAQTAARLQFFRLAFGAAGGFGDRVDVREAHRAIQAFFGNERTSCTWHSEPSVIRKDVLKLLMNLALLAGEGLIRGGNLGIVISGAENGPTAMTVRAEGPKFLFSDACEKVLSGQDDDSSLDPRTAPAWLAAQLIQFLNASLRVERLEGGVEIVANIP